MTRHGDDLVLSCQLQPRASQDQWAGLHDEAFRIRLTAAPVDGAANAALVRFLAKQFGVSKSRVTIEQGHTSRRKRVRVSAPTRLPALVEDSLAH